MFRDVPTEITDRILKLDTSTTFPFVVRFVKHQGSLEYTDFLPSNVDPNSKQNREGMLNKGPMAKIVAQQKPVELGDYSVSLFIPTDRSSFENQRKRMSRHYPYFAVGHTDTHKGVAWNDKEHHVNYFLFDYIENSPCSDFKVTDMEALW